MVTLDVTTLPEPSNPYPIHSLSHSLLSPSLYLSYTLQFANPTFSFSLSIFDTHLSIQPYLSRSRSRSRIPFPFSHFLLLLFRSVFGSLRFPEFRQFRTQRRWATARSISPTISSLASSPIPSEVI